MSEKITHVTDSSFEQEVLSAEGPVLVDYWAEWCGPCKMIAPIVDEIAQEYGDRLKVTKMDIDSNPATPKPSNSHPAIRAVTSQVSIMMWVINSNLVTIYKIFPAGPDLSPAPEAGT